MEKQEKSDIQNFLLKAKDGISFTIFIIAKAFNFSGTKNNDKETEKPGKKLKYDDVAPLFKKAYGSLKNEVKDGMSEVKDLKNKKRQYKTWSRVKQDFREWYSSLKGEFDGRYADQTEMKVEQTKPEDPEINPE